jgi:hypothetical protein
MISMHDKQALRQLILSDDPTTAELGLILNERFKLFPQTARFYKKYKRFKFWEHSRPRSVILTEIRFWALSAVLNSELETDFCSMWMDYSYRNLTHWQRWQNRITIKLPANKDWTFSRRYFGHPYTVVFRK